VAWFFEFYRKPDFMQRSSFFSLLSALLVVGAVGVAGCGGADQHNTTPSTDTSSSMGPAPDNNSANNPSLADTNYEKNKTRPITDTMKHDTVHKR
jgi:hypothetical protein